MNNFIYLKINPYQEFISQNQYKSLIRGNFQYLNDKFLVGKTKNSIGQSSLAFHLNGIGAGISTENMWVGPGFHTSLSMSNNSFGFKHYFFGTLFQQKISNYGFNFRYVISERNNENNIFYHTSLAGLLTIYNNPTITIGFNRTYLSGGVEEIIWSIEDAAKLVFEPLFGSQKRNLNYSGIFESEPDYWDPWDQLLVGFINIYFPETKSHLYLELGTDDSRANLTDLKAHWDHAYGYIFGFKKYEILGNESLFIGLEFMSNKTTANTLNPKFYRGDWNGRNFYNREMYLFSSYEGRRWGAHSGSDSDDKIILIGYSDDNFSLISSYNIERRGVLSQNFPEVKNELIILFEKKLLRYNYLLYFESEGIINYNFEKNSSLKKSRVIGIGISYFI